MLKYHRILLSSFVALIWLAHPAYAQEFNIESELLSALPVAALSAVRAHTKTTDYGECAAGGFVGVAIDLAGNGRKVDWVAKTADGCAWGAATAVIWVLKQEGTSYRVVLYSGGQSLGLNGPKSHALRDLEITSGTAGHYAETYFKFDGKLYQEFESRFVNLQDPADCKRNPDVCDTK